MRTKMTKLEVQRCEARLSFAVARVYELEGLIEAAERVERYGSPYSPMTIAVAKALLTLYRSDKIRGPKAWEVANDAAMLWTLPYDFPRQLPCTF